MSKRYERVLFDATVNLTDWLNDNQPTDYKVIATGENVCFVEIIAEFES